MNDESVLETAVRAAKEGGRLALARLGDPSYLKWKGHRDLVAGSALEVERLIVDQIHREFPDHSVLAEESTEQADLDADPLWIVDPIDGSVNFSQGIPFFSVAVGYRQEGVFRVGVVYDPCRDELFQAVQGRGARLNGQPIVVQQVGDGIEAFQQAIIGTDWPTGIQRRNESLNIASLLASEVVAVNAMGSPALGLCYVAAGRLHAYYHLDLKLWDVAAASVVLSEAGGILTDARGGSWLHSDGGYIASNGIIHGWMVRANLAVLDRASGKA